MASAAAIPDLDRANRRVISIPATIRCEHGPQDVVMTNLSVSGFCAELASPLAVGSPATIGTPTLGVHDVIVSWSQGTTHGFTFIEAIGSREVSGAEAVANVIDGGFTSLSPMVEPVHGAGSEKRGLTLRARGVIILAAALAGWSVIGAAGTLVYRAII